MNTTGHASSGGVQLSQAESGLSRWQQVSGTRARKGVSSNTGVNGSISSASTPFPLTKINYNNDSGRKFAKIKAYVSNQASILHLL
jgi:hypothetical protein